MKKLIMLFLCLLIKAAAAQVTFIGFDLPICAAPMSHTYTYYNFPGPGGSGAVHGFYIYKDGVTVYTDPGGSMGAGQYCKELIFINDSTGFVVIRSAGNSTYVMKTMNSGATWIPMGNGVPDYFGYYPVNADYGYLVTYNSWRVFVTRCTDLEPADVYPFFIHDTAIIADIYETDTVMGNSLCSIDSLRIYVNNGTDTVTYHINISSIPIGIEDHQLAAQNKYLLYPNPSSGFFRIKDELKEIKKVSLLSLEGQLIKEYDTGAISESLFSTGMLAPGFYLVKITVKEKDLFLKLMITN